MKIKLSKDYAFNHETLPQPPLGKSVGHGLFKARKDINSINKELNKSEV